MDIKGIGNEITNAYTSVSNSEQNETKFQEIFDKAIKDKDDKELKEACESFEADFVQRLFTEMRKTIPKGGLFEGSNEEKIYQDMMDEKYSETISKNRGAGIADALYKQLSPKIKKELE